MPQRIQPCLRPPRFVTSLTNVYRTESRRVFATFVRLLGDFDLAEESLSDAFASAVAQWPEQGVPANPRAWLVSAGRFKAIDTMRRRARFDASLTELANRIDANPDPGIDNEGIEDDRLRLIFTCCHPAIIARSPSRAHACAKFAGSRPKRSPVRFSPRHRHSRSGSCGRNQKSVMPEFLIKFPSREDLPDRLHTVLQVIYLVFNEGYSASSGDSITSLILAKKRFAWVG